MVVNQTFLHVVNENESPCKAMISGYRELIDKGYLVGAPENVCMDKFSRVRMYHAFPGCPDKAFMDSTVKVADFSYSDVYQVADIPGDAYDILVPHEIVSSLIAGQATLYGRTYQFRDPGVMFSVPDL